jgi:hypothetical protein
MTLVAFDPEELRLTNIEGEALKVPSFDPKQLPSPGAYPWLWVNIKRRYPQESLLELVTVTAPPLGRNCRFQRHDQYISSRSVWSMQ